ncbi:MAG TPA: M24 family metallopeptidase [Planctomycetes bacterium]|nr:M24 family metallopeptidase [Planctomycetota bacterium]
MTEIRIPTEEFQRRRQAALDALDGAIGVLFAGTIGELNETFRPRLHFEYLTGITSESGAILILDPEHPIEARRVSLLLEPHRPEVERWDGWRGPIDSGMKERYGIKTVYRTPSFATILLESAKRTKKLACLHPLATHSSAVSPDLAIFQKLQSRIPGLEVVDRSELLAVARSIKSEAELAMITRACEITAGGFAAALSTLEAGMNEYALQEVIEHSYRAVGSRGTFYGSIVGAGINGTVLHYESNDQEIAEGDLVVIDSGARHGDGSGGYGADVTRTFPASGKFSDRQREIYEIVLAALDASIAVVRPGVTFNEVDRASREIIDGAGFRDFFPHGIGHHLGLAVHDITPDGPLKEGAVITVEPGIYLPDEGFGVRIEDDVVITADGSRNLTAGIPRTVEEIESAMAR